MKALKVTNLKDRIINLGCKKGRHLMLNPNETKDIDSELATIFDSEIISYTEGGFISVAVNEEVQKKVATERNKTVVSKKTKNIIKD